MEKEDVRIVEEHLPYQGFLAVKKYHLQHKLFIGGWSPEFTRELVVRPHAAALLPYDPVLDKVVILEQFRIGALEDFTTPWLIEIVAGLIAPGETAVELVHRETKEEAGLEVLELVPIFDYWASPGFTNEHISLFCGRVDARNVGGIYGMAEEHEDIRVSTISREEALTMLHSGKIKNAIGLVAFMWLELNHHKIRQDWLNSSNKRIP